MACHSLLATMVSRGALVHFQEGCSVGGTQFIWKKINKSKVQSIPKDKETMWRPWKRLQLAPNVNMMCYLLGIRNNHQALDKYGACNIAATGQQTLADPRMSQPNPLFFSQDRLPFKTRKHSINHPNADRASFPQTILFRTLAAKTKALTIHRHVAWMVVKRLHKED